MISQFPILHHFLSRYIAFLIKQRSPHTYVYCTSKASLCHQVRPSTNSSVSNAGRIIMLISYSQQRMKSRGNHSSSAFPFEGKIKIFYFFHISFVKIKADACASEGV